MVASLWRTVVAMPWPYLVALPILFACLIGFGWTQDDYVEEHVNKIWVPTQGDYHKNKEYAAGYNRDSLGGTSFAAMAISRDGGNLFTASRLEEIRKRMEETEATTIQWKGHTITWEDICGLNNAGRGTTYEFPCARLTPMDLFQEARWYFEEVDRLTWYDEVVRKLILRPRIPRFGIMQQSCSAPCTEIFQLRTNVSYASSKGYPFTYVNPLALFDDIGSMEMNDPCRACIEGAFEVTMQRLTTYIQGSFGVLAGEMRRYNASGLVTDPADQAELGLRYQQYGYLAQTITRKDVEDYYSYSTIRALYSQFGFQSYMSGYEDVMKLVGGDCQNLSAVDNLNCPPPTVDQATAELSLLRHADSEFSSVNSAGSPFPFWSAGDGTGTLFEGTTLFPVSGSGVDLSGDASSLNVYLDLMNYGTSAWSPKYSGGYADPTTPDTNWTAHVETNPFYKWFMAGLEPSTNECKNGLLKGANTSSIQYNMHSAGVMGLSSSSWCTKYSQRQRSTKQDFAKMWYDLLLDSDQFLGMAQGEDDPYSWTIGSGCGYSLGGERDPYTNRTESAILKKASRELYFVDEGLSIGPVDRHLLLGGVTPSIEEYNLKDKPLESVSVLQTLYFGLLPEDIVDRVKNCNRPGGAITNMTEEDAKEILEHYKEFFENTWSAGWDNSNSGDVQFVIFTDDSGAIGTTGRTLLEITLDNGKLMAVSICLIALFSVILLVSPDWIESRVLVTLIGVSLVVLAFFASLGFAILAGIKINVTIAWTLPFIILGLGVDDVYIVLMALKKQPGCSENDFVQTMQEVAIPVAMTSAVNCLMFAVLCISDIPAIYKTATVACICIIALYLSVMFCFPAFCWLDMKRRAGGYRDVFFCLKAKGDAENMQTEKTDTRQVWLYDKFYYPLVLGTPFMRTVVHSFLFLGTLVLLAVGIYGITEREVGLGLEDFFPTDSQAQQWASVRTEELASWSINMNWGALNYTNPETQLKMIKQFEDVVATPHVSEIDTKFLWVASFLEWTTMHCTENFDREDPDKMECGADQLYEPEGTYCTGSWVENTIGLRNKNFPDPTDDCEPYEGGLCRPSHEMFVQDLPPGSDANDKETSWCPVADWSEEKFQWCLMMFRNVTNYSGGRFVFENETATETQCAGEFYKDELLLFPIPFSSGPTMFSYGLYSHELTLDLLEQTRAVCDYGELHCWMTGIPYDYWTQYENIFSVLATLALTSAAVGFVVAWVFMFVNLSFEKQHSMSKVLCGTLIASLIISLTVLTCLFSIIGLSVLAGVSMTGFSNMAFVLSVGFTVEYSVHITLRWLHAPNSIGTSLERVKYTMSFLMLPTFMSWISSTIGVICLAFTEFEFTEVFFFRPLIIVMMVTYFVGCYALPAFLSYIEHDFCRLGKSEQPKEAKMAPEVALQPDTVEDQEEPSNVVEKLDDENGSTAIEQVPSTVFEKLNNEDENTQLAQ